MGRGFMTADDYEKDYVDIEDVAVLRMTDKALLCVIEEEEYWIPLSQMSPDSEVCNDTDKADGTLTVKRWLADKKNLVYQRDPDEDLEPWH